MKTGKETAKNLKTFKVRLSDGTTDTVMFASKDAVMDFYEIMYNMKVSKIFEVPQKTT